MNLLSANVRALLTAAQLRAIPNTRYDAAKYMQAYARTYYFAALAARRRENLPGYIANMSKSSVFEREYKRLIATAPMQPNISAGPLVMLPTLPIVAEPVPQDGTKPPVVQAVVTPKDAVPAVPNTTAPAVPEETKAAAEVIVAEATTPWWKTPTGIAAGGAILAYVGFRVARNRGLV